MTSRSSHLAVALSLLMVVSVVGAAAPAAGADGGPGETGHGPAAVDAGHGPAAPDAVAPGIGGPDTADTVTRSADTVVVDDDGTGDAQTITQGVSEADDGDTVEVRPGTYEESVFVDANVRLVAPDGATLDGSSLSGENDAIRFAEGVAVDVEGFTVTGYAVGVALPRRSPAAGTLRDLTVRDNVIGVDARGAGYDWTLADATVEGNDRVGVGAVGATGDWELADVTLRDNGEEAVEAQGTTGDWAIADATVEGNDAVGVRANAAEGDWSITDSVVRNNGESRSDNITEPGIAAGDATGDWVVSNTTVAGNDHGIDASGTSGAWSVVGSNVSANTFRPERGQSGVNIRAIGATGDWSVHDTRIADSIVGIAAERSTGDWRVRHANVTGNAVGVLAADTGGAWTIHRTGITDNAVNGVDAEGASPAGDATRNWWGQASGPGPDQCVGNVDCGESLGQPANQEIDECTVVDQPGRYEVVADLSSDGTCIEIAASHVTVDGQGHSLTGTDPASDSLGVYANGSAGGLTGVTITDLDMSGWAHNGFGESGHAVRFEGVDDGEVSGVEITGGDYGIRLIDATGNRLADNEIDDATFGQAALALESGSDGNTLVDNTVLDADEYGVTVVSSSDNVFRANEIGWSSADNVRVVRGSGGNTFADNVVHDSRWGGTGSAGFSIGGGSDLTIRNNTVTGNNGAGIYISQAGSRYTVRDNTIEANGGKGIAVSDAGAATVRSNTVVGNGNTGIRLRDNGGHAVANNTVADNGGWGVSLRGVTDSDVTDNAVERHPDGGIRLEGGSSNNRVTGNAVENVHTRGTITWPTGIELTDAHDNRLSRNTVVNSYRGIHVTDGSSGNALTDTGVYAAGSGTRALALDGASGTTVESLDIGDSTAPNTTLSFEGSDVRISPADTAPSNPNGAGIGRLFNATSLGPDAYLDVTLHYEAGDATGVGESTLSLWTHDGSAWTEAGGATVDTDARTVSANLTAFGTHGAFGSSP
ncbi:right-handed parallel beta-helix repeat-containing protein [Halosimplex marinum]|uniref:right-handed parallel beta-helix repeat-containing protein n=1 Tax=Halosimplex marinum TaxID=3396620 RepID=UPI003F571879